MIKKLPLLVAAAGLILGGLAASPAAYADDSPVTLPPGQYSGAGSDSNGGWSCNMMAKGYFAPCVQDTPTTGDESWFKGYKLTFNWETPNDWRGNPYERCVLSYFNPQTAYSPESMAPIQLDVPAAWGSYTIPLSQYGWLQDGITAGATSLKEEYYCYTDGVGSSERVTSENAIIPDMPPTAPTDTTTTVTEDDLDVTTGGSVALGVSPLEGYNISVTDTATNEVVSTDASVSAPAASVRGGVMKPASVQTTTTASKNVVSRVFQNLKPGTYKVSVASYNKIGQSETQVKTVIVKAVQPLVAQVRSLAAKASGKDVKVTWQAPKATNVSGYQVQLVKSGKVIKQVKLAKAKHAYTFHKVAKGTYTVRVIDTAAGKRANTVTKTVIVKASKR